MSVLTGFVPQFNKNKMFASKKKESQVSERKDKLRSEEQFSVGDMKIMTVIIALNAVGLLPPAKSSSFIRLTYKTFTVFIHVIYGLTLIAELTAIVIHWGNIPVVATTMGAMSGLVASVCTSLHFLRNRNKFLNLIDMLRSELIAKLQLKYMKFIFNAEREVVFCGLLLFPLAISIAFIWIVVPFLNMNHLSNFKNGRNITEGSRLEKLIFVVWLPFEFERSPQFEIIIFLQALVISFALLMICAVDIVFLCLMSHAAAQFRVLCAKLNDMQENVSEKELHRTRYMAHLHTSTDISFTKDDPMSLNDPLSKQSWSGGTDNCGRSFVETDCLKNEDLEENPFQQYLVDCIRHHQAVLAFLDQLNEVVSVVSFLKLLNFPFLICMTGFQMTQTVDSQQQLLRFLSLFAGGVCLVSSYAWFGQQVLDESEEVATAFYGTDWYNQIPEFKGLLPLAIMRAAKPAKVKAGVFFDMSFVTLAAIMNTSYKVFMMMIQLQDS